MSCSICGAQSAPVVNFDLESMRRAVSGPFTRVPEGMSQDQLLTWMTAQSAPAGAVPEGLAERLRHIGSRMQVQVMPGSASEVWVKELVKFADLLAAAPQPATRLELCDEVRRLRSVLLEAVEYLDASRMNGIASGSALHNNMKHALQEMKSYRS